MDSTGVTVIIICLVIVFLAFSAFIYLSHFKAAADSQHVQVADDPEYGKVKQESMSQELNALPVKAAPIDLDKDLGGSAAL